MSESEKNSSKRVDSLTMIIGMIEEQNKFNKEIMKTMRTVQQEMTNEMKKIMEKQEEMKKEFDEKQEEMKQEFKEKLEKIQGEVDKLKVETNRNENFEPSLEKDSIKATDNKIIEKKQDYGYQLNNQKVFDESYEEYDEYKLEFPDEIRVFVRTLTGKRITYKVDPTEGVIELKCLIQYQERISPEEQLLTFKGREMDDRKTLAYYGIAQNSTVDLALHIED